MVSRAVARRLGEERWATSLESGEGKRKGRLGLEKAEKEREVSRERFERSERQERLLGSA